MSFNGMKEALGLLNDRLKTLGAFEDPKINPLFASGSLEDSLFLMNSFQQTIQDLSRNLGTIIQQYSNLVTSLIQRGESVTKRPTIHWLPNEIMIEIVKFLVEDGSHHLRPLLFVNKRFHLLITSVPSLWCNIEIEINEMLQEVNKLSVNYIQTCMKHSQQSFLDVGLDMARTSNIWGCTLSILSDIQERTPQFRDVVGVAMDSIREIDWFEDDAFYDRRVDEIQNLVRAIMGPEGAQMRRWKSFKFSPPVDNEGVYAGETIWELFKYPTPNLETFILNGELWVESSMFDGIFPDLSSVRHLTLHDPYVLGSVPISRRLLTAVVDHHQYEDSLKVLSDCPELQELTITNIKSNSTDQDVKLPALKKLTLEGRVGDIKHITFCTPCLESLKLFCGCEEGIPKVRARSVIWAPKGEQAHQPMMEFLRCLLGSVEEMEELVLKYDQVKRPSIGVGEMVARRDPAVVNTLRVIRIVVDEKEVDALHIRDD